MPDAIRSFARFVATASLVLVGLACADRDPAVPAGTAATSAGVVGQVSSAVAVSPELLAAVARAVDLPDTAAPDGRTLRAAVAELHAALAAGEVEQSHRALAALRAVIDEPSAAAVDPATAASVRRVASRVAEQLGVEVTGAR